MRAGSWVKVARTGEVRQDHRIRGTKARGARHARDTWGTDRGLIILSAKKSL